MNFELSADQQMLADSVDRFGRDEWPAPNRPRLLAAYGKGAPGRWKQIADLGWLALPMSQAQGGLGGSPSDIMVVAEGLGRHLVPDPFVNCGVLVAPLIGPARTDLLEAMIEGDTRVALALGDGDSRFDHLAVETRAEPRAGGYRLSGDKQFVADGADADWFIVPARVSDASAMDAGLTLFLVHRDSPGLKVERFRGMDHHRHARLQLRQVGVGGDAVLGETHGGAALLELAVRGAIVAQCAEAVGAMDALVAITLDYIRTRRQFGAAIGSFQAIQHRMVDMAIAAEEARSILYRATLELAAGEDDGGRMASAAKVRVGQSSLFVARQAVQLHGGVGTSDELVVSHYLKRLMMIDLTFGHVDHHRTLFAAAA